MCNFQFKTYFESCVFGVVVCSWVPGSKVFAEDFFIPLCIHFWCVSDVALHWNKCPTTIKLTTKWLTSSIEAFHVEKSPKRGQKFLQTEFFYVSCGESVFGQGSGEMSNEYACKVSRLCHFRTWNFFPKEGHSTMMDRHSSSPKFFLTRPSLESLAVAMDLWHAHAITDGDSAARSAKSWPPVTFAWVVSAWSRARSRCRRPYWQEIHMSYVNALVASFLVISFYVILLSSLLKAHKPKIQFLSKPNQTSTVNLLLSGNS